MRVYFDSQGRPRGASTSLSGAIGLWWLSIFLFPLLLVLVYFPRAVYRTGLSPTAKLAIVLTVWAALILLGTIVGAQ